MGPNPDGPLHLAARFGDAEVVSEFIAHGCDIESPNADGLSPELIARRHGFVNTAIDIADAIGEKNKSPHNSWWSKGLYED